LSFIRLNNLKALTIFLWCFLFYDVFWVFISKYFFGTSVMESVAVQVMDKFYLPMLITFPKFFGKGGGSSLGNGDYVLPGVFICQLYFLDKHYHFSERESSFSLKNLGYFKISLLSYTAGLIFSLIMVIATERGQPALLYLVPAITIPVIIVAYKRDQLTLIMKPVPKPKQEQDMESLIISNNNSIDDDDTNTNSNNSSSDDYYDTDHHRTNNNNNSILINSINSNNNNNNSSNISDHLNIK